MRKDEYIELRKPFIPEQIKVIFLFESPPDSGKYFYNTKGEHSEPLFRAMMKCILCIDPKTKEEGLDEFKRRGFLLLDATYDYLLNKNYTGTERREIIFNSLDDIDKELSEYIKAGAGTKIICVTKYVCEELVFKLIEKKWNILNKKQDLLVPFPGYGWQKVFCRKVKELLQITSYACNHKK